VRAEPATFARQPLVPQLVVPGNHLAAPPERMSYPRTRPSFDKVADEPRLDLMDAEDRVDPLGVWPEQDEKVGAAGHQGAEVALWAARHAGCDGRTSRIYHLADVLHLGNVMPARILNLYEDLKAFCRKAVGDPARHSSACVGAAGK
jgi:hypothetical protein